MDEANRLEDQAPGAKRPPRKPRKRKPQEMTVVIEVEDEPQSPGGESGEAKAMADAVRGLSDLLRQSAAVRKGTLEALTEYLNRSWAPKEDDPESETQYLHLRGPVDDKDLESARLIYLTESFRSMAQVRGAVAALAEHARKDSRILADLAAWLAGGILPADQD